MFEALKGKRRDLMKVSTAWFLFGAIIVVFIFWGLTPHHEGFGQGGVAAYVNDEAIPMREVFQTLENMRQSEQADGAEESETARKQKQARVVQQLVQQELITQAAGRARFDVSDDEVRDFLIKQPVFQEKGQFRREYYANFLKARGMTASELEGQIRRDLLIQKIERVFSAAMRPSELEVAKQKELADAKTNLEFLTLSSEPLAASAVPADEVKAFLQKDAAAAKAYFDSHQGEFSQAEEVHARHILVKFEGGKAESESKALEKARAIKAQLDKGEDFGKIASAQSDDPGSKAKGGDLGFFGRGRMVPEFEEAAFTGALKKVSEPVRTDYGYHLIEALERKAAKPGQFDQATETSIARKLIAERKAAQAIDRFQALAAKGDTTGVEKLAQELKLTWEETGPFSIEAPAIPKIGANDQIARVAFSLTAAKPLAPEVFRQGPKAFVVRYRALPAKTASTGKPGAKGALPDFEKPEFMQALMASQKTREAMGNWVRALEKNSRVELAPIAVAGAE